MPPLKERGEVHETKSLSSNETIASRKMSPSDRFSTKWHLTILYCPLTTYGNCIGRNAPFM